MSIVVNQNSRMASPFLHEFKRQASFFLKEKIKTARLVLTDVTPAELLTEEATDVYFWPPDTRTMGVISRAAFEIDDYWRIVEILHKRLMKFDKNDWRVSYKTLLVLEHLLTHGPLRVADEFQCDKLVIEEIGSLAFVDENRVNWGSSARNVSDKVLHLLKDGEFLKEERARARKVTRGIKGFGSLLQRSSSDEIKNFENNPTPKKLARSHSDYVISRLDIIEDGLSASTERLLTEDMVEGNSVGRDTAYTFEDHPFYDNHKKGAVSLLS